MTLSSLSRLRHVDLAELTWRAREAGDTALTRAWTRVRPPQWRRGDLASVLTAAPELESVRAALRAERWQDAHTALTEFVLAQPSRFVIAPSMRERLREEITRRFPDAASDARTRVDRLLRGRYDLLGYTDLEFDGRSWHTDPVHGRTAPLLFWSRVPYLSAECGDHKVTWEFNRHQHWLALGRAYWLTGHTAYRDECIRQLCSWLDANPPLMGVNWASMLELGLRSVSWIWALNFFAEGAEHDRSPWIVDLLLGLDRQLDHVERHLSYYFSPNTHLLGEALALYVAGRALPFLHASGRREAVGRRVLLQEITRQIAPDGGHCERSAHYHRYTLDFYLLALAVARITDDPAAGVFERTCARLAQTARALADDEGYLPLIGDDDGGTLLPITRRRPDDVRDSLAISAAVTARTDLMLDDPHEEVWWLLGHDRFADARQRLERAARRTPAVSTALPATGYYVSRNERGDHLIVDGGPHGYLNGGHAHADALSLVFTHRGRPLLIDTGTGAYTIDPALRDRFRSTAMHNTLTINGRSQSLPRGPFHWRHTADATTRRWRMNRYFDYFVGGHDAYAPMMHFRQVLMLHDDLLVVADCVLRVPGLKPGPTFSASAGPGFSRDMICAHWHLHPQWSVDLSATHAVFTDAGDAVELHVAGGTLERFTADAATGLGWYAPAYGRIVPTTTLRITTRDPLPVWIVSAFGLDSSNRIHHVALAPLDTSGETEHYGTVIVIERERTTDRIIIAEPLDEKRHLRWRACDIDGDARMLFARGIGQELTALALVDGMTVRSERYPHAERSYPSRTNELYVDLTASGQSRKAS
jgi:uncharacterized heparinase superfamily protein